LKKRKIVVCKDFPVGRAPHSIAASQWSPQPGTAPKKGRGRASMKDKAKKVLLDSEVRTSEDLPPRVRNSCMLMNGKSY
jgi:hypothetical protein